MKSPTQQQRRAMERQRDRLQKRRTDSIDRYRMEAKSVHGECIILADVCDVAVALRDPVLGPRAMEALRCTWLTAEGMPEAGMDACYCCGESWTWKRVPRLCLVLHVSLPESALLTFACEVCARDHARVAAGLESGVRRDFFGGAKCRHVPISLLSAESGHA